MQCARCWALALIFAIYYHFSSIHIYLPYTERMPGSRARCLPQRDDLAECMRCCCVLVNLYLIAAKEASLLTCRSMLFYDIYTDLAPFWRTSSGGMRLLATSRSSDLRCPPHRGKSSAKPTARILSRHSARSRLSLSKPATRMKIQASDGIWRRSRPYWAHMCSYCGLLVASRAG